MENDYDKLLNIILNKTNCEFGFIAVKNFTTEDVFLTIKAVSLNAYPDITGDIHKLFLSKFRHVNIKTIFGECFKENRCIFWDDKINTINELPIHLPYGHSRIRNFVSIPINKNNLVYGILAIANGTIGKDIKDNIIQELETITNYMAHDICKVQFNYIKNYVDSTKFYEEKDNETTKRLEDIKNNSEIRSRRFASMNHELRTPLHGIIGTCDILESLEDIPIEVLENLQTIKASSSLMMNVIDNVLNYVKIEALKITTSIKWNSFSSMMNEVHHILKVSFDKDHFFNVKYISDEDNSFIPSLVFIDKNCIEQIILNLATNSYKFGAKNVLVIIGKKVKNVIFRIEDDGIGIEQENLQNIFKPYFRGSDEYSGSGLGLSVVIDLIENLGGQITVESIVSKMTAFIITIPGAFPVIKNNDDEINTSIFMKAMYDFGEDVRPITREIITSYMEKLNIIFNEKSKNLNPDNYQKCIIFSENFTKEKFIQINHNFILRSHPSKFMKIIVDLDYLDNRSNYNSKTMLISVSEDISNKSDDDNKKLIVVIADDNATNLKILKFSLKKILNGNKILESFTDGDQVMEYIKTKDLKSSSEEIILMILDNHMPNMNGLVAIKNIIKEFDKVDQKQPAYFILTADDGHNIKKECLEMNINLLTKPLSIKDMKKIFEKYI